MCVFFPFNQSMRTSFCGVGFAANVFVDDVFLIYTEQIKVDIRELVFLQ